MANESDGMKAMWVAMRDRQLSKRDRGSRSHSQPCVKFSSDNDSWYSCSSSISSRSSRASRQALPKTSDTTGACGSNQNPGELEEFGVPQGCVVRNTFLEWRETADSDDDDGAERLITSCSANQGSVGDGLPQIPNEPCVEPSHISSSLPLRLSPRSSNTTVAAAIGDDAPVSCEDDSPTRRPPAKPRLRPPKPKRVQAKLLAERVFRSQNSTDAEKEDAESQFLRETSGDPVINEYAYAVLRALNTEAGERAGRGEDPAGTTVNL